MPQEPFRDTVIDEDRERVIINSIILQNREGLERLAHEEANSNSTIFQRLKYWYENKKSKKPKIGTVLL